MGATEQTDEERRDPARLLALAPSEEEAPAFLTVSQELVQPGQGVEFPERLVADIVGSRRYLSAANLEYEAIDGSLLMSLSIVDLGDPRVLATVGADGWTDAPADGLPTGALSRPDAVPDDPYADLGVAWTRGPVLMVIVGVR